MFLSLAPHLSLFRSSTRSGCLSHPYMRMSFIVRGRNMKPYLLTFQIQFFGLKKTLKNPTTSRVLYWHYWMNGYSACPSFLGDPASRTNHWFPWYWNCHKYDPKSPFVHFCELSFQNIGADLFFPFFILFFCVLLCVLMYIFTVLGIYTVLCYFIWPVFTLIYPNIIF